MRLGQLARKLDIDTSKIYNALTANDFDVENQPNFKLSVDAVTFIENEFKPIEEQKAEPDALENEVSKSVEKSHSEDLPLEEPAAESNNEALPKEDTVEEPKEATDSNEVVVEEITEVTEETSNAPLNTEVDISNHQESEASENEVTADFDNEDLPSNSVLENDVFRVKKVKLEGIKVIGKIELPEKPKPENKKAPETDHKTDEELVSENENVQEVSTETEEQLGPKIHPSKLARQKAHQIKAVEVVDRPQPDSTSDEKKPKPKNKKQNTDKAQQNTTAQKGKKKEAEQKQRTAAKSKKENEEAQRKAKLREKRQRQREKEKAVATQKISFWKKLWDSMW